MTENGSASHFFDSSSGFNIFGSVFNSYAPQIPIARRAHTTFNENDVYVRLLLSLKRGYPLRDPKPITSSPSVYQQEGVRIGDVGILTESGEFDYFFNACCPANDPLNVGRVPQDFTQLCINPNQVQSKEIPPGSFFARHFDQNELQTQDIISSFTSLNQGALLILPEGGKQANHPQDQKFIEYAAKCAHSWCNHVTDPEGDFARKVEGLYIVTGCDKTRAWGIATVDSKDITLNFGFKQSGIGEPPEYEFYGRGYPSAFGGSGNSQSQSGCVFLRGYKITVRDPLARTPLDSNIKVKRITHLVADDLLPNTIQLQAPSFAQIVAAINPFWALGTLVSGSAHDNAEPMDDGVSPSCQLIHPSDVINRWILENHSKVDVAITHDNDWASVIDDDEYEMPEHQDLIGRISKYLRIVQCVAFTYACFDLHSKPTSESSSYSGQGSFSPIASTSGQHSDSLESRESSPGSRLCRNFNFDPSDSSPKGVERRPGRQKGMGSPGPSEPPPSSPDALKEAAARAAKEKSDRAKAAQEEAEKKLRQGVQSEIWPTDQERETMKRNHQYAEGLFHVAIAGISGSGKSSLINAFLGLRTNDEGAAATDTTETTALITRYPSRNPNQPFVWYDVPGAGIPAWQYFNAQGLYIFDCIIVLFDNRFTATDIAVLRNCERFGISSFIVRSKSNQHIWNIALSMGYNEDEDSPNARYIAFQAARERHITETHRTVQRFLEETNLPIQRVYIVDESTLRRVIKSKTPKDIIDEAQFIEDLGRLRCRAILNGG